MSCRAFLVVVCILSASLQAAASDSYIVKLRSKSGSRVLAPFRSTPAITLAARSAKIRENVQNRAALAALDDLDRYHIVQIDHPTQLNTLRAHSDVEDVTPMARYQVHGVSLTADSLSSQQYALQIIGADKAWKIATGKGVVVGIIDTGIDWNHEDLRDALAITPAEDINGNNRFDPWLSTVSVGGVFGDLNGVDDDGNGVVDDVIGYDFVDQTVRNLGDDQDRDPVPFDEQGHGTLVAGVIAATPNNNVGIAGLAYSSKVRVLRAFDATGNAEEDDVASALVYAALTGVQIVNMSFGDGVDSPLLRDAVRFAHSMNIVLVASVGNSGGVSRQYPAGYSEVMAVAATNADDLRAPFSSTGSLVSLSAPGQSIITTSVGSRYRSVSGTSFSAPYVAATAALMMELNPKMSAQTLRSVIEERSVDLGEVGWDGLFGAGRLRADEAVSTTALSLLELIQPGNESEWNVLRQPRLPVVATVRVAPFRSFAVYLGAGIEPSRWSKIVEKNTPVNADTITTLEGEALPEGMHVVRLLVNCTDGRTLERRARIRVVRAESLRIDSVEIAMAWNTERKVPVITINTSRPTSMDAVVSTPYSTVHVTDVMRTVRSHCIALSDTISVIDPTSITIIATARDGQVSTHTDTIEAQVQGAPTVSSYATTGTAPWAAYVLNDVRNIYNDNKPTVVMTDLSSGMFGGLRTMQLSGDEWVVRDSISNVWIPRGMSDVNGNGLLEVFVHSIGKAVLFEQRQVGGSPFASVIFADTNGRQNAAGVADIDGDGREELLMLSDSGCAVVTWRNGRFERLGLAVNPTPPATGMSTNRVDEISIAAGDFDGDGRVDIAFGDTDGDLVISSWNGSAFTTSFVFESNGGGGSGYVAAGDVNADGRPDVLFGVPDKVDADAEGEYGRNLWTYRLFAATAPGLYDMAWTDVVFGVRSGIGYRNGVEVAQLDTRPGAEIIICAFPRLYVFGMDAASATIVPRWYRPNVASPRFLTYDFTNNGVKELGFGTTTPGVGAMTSFTFAEVDTSTRMQPPVALRGRYEQDTVIALDWISVSGAARYSVQASTNNGPFRSIDTLVGTRRNVVVPAGVANVRYAVIAHPPEGVGQQSSVRSNILTFERTTVTKLVGVTPQQISESQSEDGCTLVMEFSAALWNQTLQPSAFRLANMQGNDVHANTANAGKPNTVVVQFPALSARDSLHVHIHGLVDWLHRPIPDTTLYLRIYPDTQRGNEIYLAAADVEDPTHLRVRFSQPVNQTALQASHYTIQPAGLVVSVERVDEATVRCELASSAPIVPRGVPYSVTVENVVAADGTPITTGAGSTISFIVVATSATAGYVYPHPVKLSRDESVTFAGLPVASEVEVFDAYMRPLQKLSSIDASGGIRWTLLDSRGNRVSPGMYFFRVTGTRQDGSSVEPALLKMVIER
mgnify:CR=1 FL=1